MNTQAIAHYMVLRAKQNADWYRQKNAITHATPICEVDELFFYLVNFISLDALSLGHTLIVLDGSVKLADLSATVPSWQITLFSPVIDWLCIQAQTGDLSEADYYWQHLQNLALEHKQKEVCLNDIMSKATVHFTQNTHHQATSLDEFYQMLTVLVHSYDYVCHTLHHKFDAFCQLLEDNYFFGNASDTRAMTPIILHHAADKLYLWGNRAWQAEKQLLAHLKRIDSAVVNCFDTDNLSSSLNTKQQQAIKMVSNHAFGIITGGPGTGKTFTVAQIVLALYANNPNTRLALAAPTGKAAQRMSESLQKALPADKLKISLPEPNTLHRLLGIARHGIPRYDESQPLPFDVIIVDEASMLGTEMARRLVCATKTGTRLILLGDAHQLAAVEAGAVLSDLCCTPMFADHLVHLVQSQRFNDESGVGRLAKIINGTQPNKADLALQLLLDDASLGITWLKDDESSDGLDKAALYQAIMTGYQAYFEATRLLLRRFSQMDADAQADAIWALFITLNRYRILTASHLGRCGDHKINEFIAKMHQDYLKLQQTRSPWYHGRVVMVQTNRYDLGLFNGDVGICLQEKGQFIVQFDGNPSLRVSSALLGDDVVTTAYAMTVHKSQGSEFDEVAVVFDGESERLLTTELIYTAITRAKQSVQIYSTPNAFNQAVNTPTVRVTGLGLVSTLITPSCD
ncbi:exodeoxyribonuclease V subunit alpha [Moraxella nasovis]|uniref:exodeoxyribonuclease V subunit alpha n=1 Tax=Moraxella nasovis TaxID=2904121 RepID=UPI001F6062AC|nr:exodeoxyribonuclease V subunit alpha [Moraxella nasovis]UNU73251.1 exodeoxyribonuclease V subunit alpha [Moraxella nasovis]